MYLLDTNVVSELRKAKSQKSHPGVDAWARSVPASSMFISVITVLELEQGEMLIRRRDASQAKLLRAWIDSFVLPSFAGRILSIDLAVAQRCAALHVPNPRADRDSLIAATALVHDMTLVTRNVGDFTATGASILNPWDSRSSSSN